MKKKQTRKRRLEQQIDQACKDAMKLETEEAMERLIKAHFAHDTEHDGLERTRARMFAECVIKLRGRK